MTCPSMVRPGQGLGLGAECIQLLPAQMLQVGAGRGCCDQRARAELRTDHRALGLWSGWDPQKTQLPRREGPPQFVRLMLFVFRPGQHRRVTEERCAGQGAPGPCKEGEHGQAEAEPRFQGSLMAVTVTTHLMCARHCF